MNKLKFFDIYIYNDIKNIIWDYYYDLTDYYEKIKDLMPDEDMRIRSVDMNNNIEQLMHNGLLKNLIRTKINSFLGSDYSKKSYNLRSFLKDNLDPNTLNHIGNIYDIFGRYMNKKIDENTLSYKDNYIIFDVWDFIEPLLWYKGKYGEKIWRGDYIVNPELHCNYEKEYYDTYSRMYKAKEKLKISKLGKITLVIAQAND